MKITGGSFGHKGSAYVAGRVFAVEGISKKDYRAADIKAVDTRIERSRSFGMLGFIVGAAIFSLAGLALLGIIGALIGFAISVAGSFYTSSTNVVEVEFVDGNRLTAEGTDRSIKTLIRFANSD